MSGTDDTTLLRDYALHRSEPAFQSLVERYLVLVYSTALRQLGNRALAEEVAQNVFVVLARSPHAFRYGTTLSSWLYKTTLLQARQTIRAELRRKRREETAVELGSIAGAESDWAPLLPMLDEAILSLRQSDRAAVVLRFLEDKPFREVGQALGISEDAAQKRVAKALEGLTQFFRRRGFAVPVMTTLSAPLFSDAVKAAPAGLAATLTQFALREASLAPASAVALFLTQLMNITNTQTAAVCLLIGALPVAITWNTLRETRAEQANLNHRLGDILSQSSEADATLASLEASYRFSVEDRSRLQQVAASRSSAPLVLADPAFYPWNENSDFVRVPKSLLSRISIPAGLRTSVGATNIPLGDELKAVLRITPAEEAKLMALLDDTRRTYRLLEAKNSVPSGQHVNYRLIRPFRGNQRIGGRGFQVLMDTAVSPDPGPEDPVEIVSFRVNPFPEERQALWGQFDSSLQMILGSERSKLFMDQAEITVHFLAGERSVSVSRQEDRQVITQSYLLSTGPEAGVYLANAMTTAPQPVGARGGGGGGSGGGGNLFEAAEDQFAPEAMKPILVRWRAQIAALKTQSGGNQP